MTCIYCAGRRGDSAMSLEHIWPQSLGGAASPQLFKSNDVCETCNSLAGLWVDGAFLKSWFVTNESSMSARQYLDPAVPGIAPFHYMGIDQEFPNQAEHICERWTGQAGEHIYHIHLADQDRWYGYAGGDIIRRKKVDAGRAYLVLTSQSTYWNLTALKSFVVQFKGVRLFCLTKVQGMPIDLATVFTNENEASAIENSEIAWIRARPNGAIQQMRASLRLDFSDRFLAKLSLGIGANLFGEAFCSSPYAGELRKLLWPKSATHDDLPKIRGQNFWQENILSAKSLDVGWPGVWTILLNGVREGFALHVCTPGGRGMTMAISEDNQLCSSAEFQSYHLGSMFFAIPARQTFIGPVSLPNFLAHRLGNYNDPILASMEALKCDPNQFTPPW